MDMTLELADSKLRMAPMDAHAVRILMDAGALPNDGRVELVDGALVEMSPANEKHGSAMISIGGFLRYNLPKPYRVVGDAAAYLSDDLMLGPDIVVLSCDAKSHEAKGSDFDLIIEISHTTLTQDLGWKAERYARHGVREYWVVDLENEKLHIHRKPEGDTFQTITVQDWTTEARPHLLPDVTLTLADILAE